MKLLSTSLSLLLTVVFSVSAQSTDTYLQFANHTNLNLTATLNVEGDASMVTPGQPLIRPWQNPNYHFVGTYVEVVILELLFDIYTKHKRESMDGKMRSDKFLRE